MNLDPILHAVNQAGVICTLKLVMHMFKDRDEKLHQRVNCQTDNEADPHQNYQSAKNWPACLTLLEMNFLNFPLSGIPLSQAFLKLISSTFIHMDCVVSN